ncbi:MAG TPA: nucleotidyltransferase domain-containing protein [Xanthobacteraceae bacterium]|nr:nucleotidyltransferase domain-containing protein [Xanthobacteraceae bacterium]
MSGLAEALFSRSQLRVLSILFGHPERSFHAAEIIRLARTGSGAVQRELARLENSGILQAELLGNRKLFRANRSSPIFGELRAIILKTVGLREPIRQALLAFKSRINVAFVYGSVARGADKAESDIDIMIIGDMLSYSEIYVALQSAERLLMRKINPTLVTTSEWKSKLAERNPFIVKVSKQPKLYIFGSGDELKGIGQSR